uniref:PORR domain-containing protein n=1 Tax=Solanum tuberosum TaxID=4113 RepID=M1CBT2_SOLTU
MLTRANRLPFFVINRFKFDLGLPHDYLLSFLSEFPEYFQICQMGFKGADGREVFGLELVKWRKDLAVSVVEKGVKREDFGGEKRVHIRYSMNLPRGFDLQKKVKIWAEEWQNLPYISPYEDAFHLAPNSDQAEKWTVGVIHELLSLLISKKTERENIYCLGDHLGFGIRFRKALVHHPGIFYLSNKIRTHTIVLREAFNKNILVEKHPLMRMRYKYISLMNKVLRRGIPINAGALRHRKRLASVKAANSKRMKQVKRIYRGKQGKETCIHKKLATAAEAVFTFNDLSFCRVLLSKLPSLCAPSDVKGDSRLFKNVHVLMVVAIFLAKRMRVGRPSHFPCSPNLRYHVRNPELHDQIVEIPDSEKPILNMQMVVDPNNKVLKLLSLVYDELLEDQVLDQVLSYEVLDLQSEGSNYSWRPINLPQHSRGKTRMCKLVKKHTGQIKVVFTNLGIVYSIWDAEECSHIGIDILDMVNESYIGHTTLPTCFYTKDDCKLWNGKLSFAKIVKDEVHVLILESYNKKQMKWADGKLIIKLPFLKDVSVEPVIKLLYLSNTNKLFFVWRDKESIHSFDIKTGKLTIILSNYKLSQGLYLSWPGLFTFKGLQSSSGQK